LQLTFRNIIHPSALTFWSLKAGWLSSQTAAKQQIDFSMSILEKYKDANFTLLG